MAEKIKYTDDDIRKMKKVTPAIACQYLDGFATAMCISIAMREKRLPIGEAVYNREKNSWRYYIEPERLIAYKYGKVYQADVVALEKKMDELIREFRHTVQELKAERAMANQ